jgi:hypothetical protein
VVHLEQAAVLAILDQVEQAVHPAQAEVLATLDQVARVVVLVHLE